MGFSLRGPGRPTFAKATADRRAPATPNPGTANPGHTNPFGHARLARRYESPAARVDRAEMVEVAGVEPACLRPLHATSTCIVRL